ncbi:MAG: hypothetical protein V3V49_03600 [Candidatus Krumholzibacteria bacterium]
MIRLTVLLFALVAAVSPARPQSYDWRSWGSVTDTIAGADAGGRVYLSSVFIEAGSETVVVNGKEFSTDFYEINYQRGVFRFTVGVGDDALITVSYTRLPFLLNSVYAIREIEFADTPQRPPPAKPVFTQKKQSLFDPTGDLVFGGVKSITLSTGTNKSTSLDQSLRATVEGNLTPTIKVKALLSDDNLPIQPRGNTQELEYLDKVFVEFTGPRASALLGDFAFQNNMSKYSTFRRELKGASGQATFGNSTFGAAAGSAKGVFRSITFRGTEQLQGPYDLLPQGRAAGEVIIAGTEKVYFDGELLQRGQNRDYTIDYDRGTLTFTPRRLVTADTEIGVDFELTQQQFDRTSVFGSSDTRKLPGGFILQTLVAREKDDSDRPSSTTLSDADLSVIEAAGDEPDQAIANGVTLVGAGEGEYVLIPGDSLAGIPDHYEFDDTTGTFVLAFVNVGAGRGDYVLDGITADGRPVYRFAGQGQGNLVIGRQLPLPQSHSIFTTRLARAQGRFDFDLQYNVSNFDANTLSSRGDGDNIGDAGELAVVLRDVPAPLGKLELSGVVSTVRDRFRSLEKTRAWFFYRDWNLEGVPLIGREVISEVTTSFIRSKNLRVDYQLAGIRRDNFDGIKQEGRLSLVSLDDRSLNARVFSTDVEGDNQQRTREHGTMSLSYGFWQVVPSVVLSTEEFLVQSPVLPDTGIAYDRYVVRLGKRKYERFNFSVQVEERNTEQLADTTGGFVDTRRDRTFSGSLAARGTGVLQAELQYSHRIEDDRRLGGSRTSDLARLKGILRLQRIGVRSNFDYEISQNQFRSQEKSVVFVGEGQGDFNELGEPVGKGRGAYTVIFLPTLQTTPTRRVDFTLHTFYKAPAKGSRWQKGDGLLAWLRANVSLRQAFSIKEETTFDDAYKVYLFFPSALQRDDATLNGVISLRQDWSLLDDYPNLSLTLRYQRDDEEENRFNSIKEDRFFEQQIVRVDRSMSRLLTLNAAVTREIRRRRGKGLPTGTGSTYDATAWKLGAGWGLRLSGGSTVDGVLEFQRQEDGESGAEETALSLRPRFVWRVSKAFNVFGRYEVTRFSGEEPQGIKPLFFSNEGTTHRWSLTPNLKLSKAITMLATYEGRSEKTFSGNRITENEFRIETRAFF